MSVKRIIVSQTPEKIGENVLIFGWIHKRRDHGKLIFCDLRDRGGILQIVFEPKDAQLHELANSLRSEFVVAVWGEIKKRPKNLINPKIITGTVEMSVTRLEIVSQSKTPPFELDKDTLGVNEEIRLRHRYLDLRTQRMKNNVVMRHKIIRLVRDYFDHLDFIEVETPYLTKGTPEGAREFIVPARLWPGKFYVLPQSPQQFKQLLMVAGMEKYYQIARCFRDEDQRGDRQPEFTQIDVELSFTDQEEVLNLIENLMVKMAKTLYPEKKITRLPFPRLKYEEAVAKYKTDKPDIRKDRNNPDELGFCWVIDMPMFKKSETEKKIVATHHPFTMPNAEDMAKYPDDPLKWRANAYDLSLNGFEIWGGSIRIHLADIQQKVFNILGLNQNEIDRRFGHMMEAFSYGVPPHGGIAAGLDRIIAILQREPNIREVMAFPKTGDNRDLMMDAPNIVSEKTLKETHIKLSEEVNVKAGTETSLVD
ncbi:aspartate--tRNA ligase [Candidatus Parcubacteria bacterium]|nr:MAG: aspartate--tRNA ligase [Candidatus Parcubacteria bacterium]